MTIYDIAREAGVSASTVSRVVNGKPGVNPRTRMKVQELLDQCGYVPNETARGLVTSNSRLVGILVADVRTQHHIEGTYYISRELMAQGYCSLILNTGGSDEERVGGIRMLEQRKVEAAVLIGSIFQSDAVEKAIGRYLPEVPVFMLNGFLNLPNVYGVLSDERGGVENCVRLLERKGRRRILFIVDAPTPSSKLKTQGFIDGMTALGYKRKDLCIYSGVEGSIRGGYMTMKKAIKENPDLDGVICSLDIIACGALHALREEHVSVPGQVSVIGIDNSPYAEICTPQLSSLDNMTLDSGMTIAHKLIDCLEGRTTNQRTLLYTNIVERGTT